MDVTISYEEVETFNIMRRAEFFKLMAAILAMQVIPGKRAKIITDN